MLKKDVLVSLFIDSLSRTCFLNVRITGHKILSSVRVKKKMFCWFLAVCRAED